MILDYQGEVLETIALEGNVLFPTFSSQEIANRVSRFNNFNLSPSDLLSISTYRYAILFLYTVFALVFIFGFAWTLFFVFRALPYIHNSKVGLPIYIRKPTGEVVEALFKPFVWCDLRCLMILQKFTFMFEKPTTQASAPAQPASQFHRGIGQGLSHGDN